MTKPFLILRIGLGITFIWIGVLIWQEPLVWSSFMPEWMTALLPVAPDLFMRVVSVADVLLGLLLISGKFLYHSSLAAALHLLVLVFLLGFSAISARDFGLFMAAVALFVFARERKTPRN